MLPVEYPEISPSDVRILLLEGGERLLTMFVPRLSRYTRHQLERRGIEVRTNTLVKSADDGGVVLADGTEIPTASIVWTAGVRPNDASGRSDTRIEVDEQLRIAGVESAYAIGDVAAAATSAETSCR